MPENLKDFENPTSYWEYDGPFSVELTDDADETIVPPGVEVQGRTVYVRENGRVKQTMGGIQLRADGQPFYWGYRSMKIIRKGDGTPLWVNWDYR